jgi:hypothetical protein
LGGFIVSLYLIRLSCQDIYIFCLFFLQCFDEKERGYIFRGMPESHIKSLFFYTVPNEALALRNHFALMPYIFLMQKDCAPLQGVEFDQDVSPLKSIVWL